MTLFRKIAKKLIEIFSKENIFNKMLNYKMFTVAEYGVSDYKVANSTPFTKGEYQIPL